MSKDLYGYPTKESFNKLPKWAQAHIEHLEKKAFDGKFYVNQNWFDVRLDGNSLVVVGNDSIIVAPHSSNMVLINHQRK